MVGEAYARAAGGFFSWCEARGLKLETIDPVTVAAYVGQLLDGGRSKPTVKQHLAAIRMLFDRMVTGGRAAFQPGCLGTRTPLRREKGEDASPQAGGS